MVFLAPGAGLGHIVRVSAIAHYLEKKNTPCLVVTTSKWAKALERITGITTTFFHIKKWQNDISHYLSNTQSSIIVQDTFPFGLRNENLKDIAKKTEFAYLARYLKIDDYFNAINKNWDKHSPLLSTIIEIEPLSDDHKTLISETSANHYKLKNRIRFPYEKMKQTVPPDLQDLLSSNKLHLVVHSGPQHETERLIMIAENNIKKDSKGELAIISPVYAEMKMKNAYDYFPAAALFNEAYHIYTGGGYNTITETELFPDKVTALPFPRSYDDQQARIDNLKSIDFSSNQQSGAIQAAEIISSLLE